jgi:hypothetical protein
MARVSRMFARSPGPAVLLLTLLTLSPPRVTGDTPTATGLVPAGSESATTLASSGGPEHVAAAELEASGPMRVWPLPRAATFSGGPRAVASGFRFVGAESIPSRQERLDRVLSRYTAALLKGAPTSSSNHSSPLQALHIECGASTEVQPTQHGDNTSRSDPWLTADRDVYGEGTSLGYSLSLGTTSAPGEHTDRIVASTLPGCIAALETLLQVCPVGSCNATTVQVSDEPQFAVRGLMVDTGRRCATRWCC